MKGFIAVDGGGSKTELVLFNELGNIFSHEMISCTNPNDIGIEISIKRLEISIKKMMKVAKKYRLNLSNIFLGIAGVEFGNIAKVIKEALQQKLKFESIVVEGDLASVKELSLSELNNGAVIISGTGFNMSFKINGEFNNVGGWGYMPDNYLSGLDLGKDALIACSKAIDGIGQETCLVSLLETHFGNKLWYAMDEIYKSGIKGVASLSRYVVEGYLSGDKVSKSIIDTRIKNLVNTIKKKSNEIGMNIYLCGGIFENNSFIVEKMQKLLGEDYKLILTTKKTIYGAVSLSRKKYTGINEDFYKIFDREYKGLM